MISESVRQHLDLGQINLAEYGIKYLKLFTKTMCVCKKENEISMVFNSVGCINNQIYIFMCVSGRLFHLRQTQKNQTFILQKIVLHRILDKGYAACLI